MACDVKSICEIVMAPSENQIAKNGSVDFAKENISKALYRAVLVDANAISNANAHAMPALTTFFMDALKGRSPLTVEQAAAAVGALCRKNYSHRTLFIKADATTLLVKLLQCGNPGEKKEAANALGSVMKDVDVRDKVKELGGITALQQLAKTGTDEQVAMAKRALNIGTNCTIS